METQKWEVEILKFWIFQAFSNKYGLKVSEFPFTEEFKDSSLDKYLCMFFETLKKVWCMNILKVIENLIKICKGRNIVEKKMCFLFYVTWVTQSWLFMFDLPQFNNSSCLTLYLPTHNGWWFLNEILQVKIFYHIIENSEKIFWKN